MWSLTVERVVTIHSNLFVVATGMKKDQFITRLEAMPVNVERLSSVCQHYRNTKKKVIMPPVSSSVFLASKSYVFDKHEYCQLRRIL